MDPYSFCTYSFCTALFVQVFSISTIHYGHWKRVGSIEKKSSYSKSDIPEMFITLILVLLISLFDIRAQEMLLMLIYVDYELFAYQ